MTDHERLCRFLAERDVKCLNTYRDGFVREGRGQLGKLAIRGISKTVSALSAGTLTADHNDVLYIAVKSNDDIRLAAKDKPVPKDGPGAIGS